MILKGATHVIIVACYHPLPFPACMLHFVSMLFGTSIPTSFNILLKMLNVFTHVYTETIESHPMKHNHISIPVLERGQAGFEELPNHRLMGLPEVKLMSQFNTHTHNLKNQDSIT